MAINKEKKKEILSKLADVTDHDSIVFVNFHGLPVNETVRMRSKLRESDVSYFVAKKTLIRKAFADAKNKVAGEMPSLEGELALVYGADGADVGDVTAPAREIHAFQKSLGGSVSILGGVFDGRFLTKSEMEEIALIPSLDTLRGMFVNVINSPIQGFVLSLKAIADKKEASA